MVIKPNRWLEIHPSAVEVGGFSLHPHMHLTNQTTFGASFYSNASDFSQFKCDTSCLWSMLGGLSGSAAGYKGGEKGGGGVLPVTTLGILVMKLFTVLMGTPSVSSWMRVTISSICRRGQERKDSSSRANGIGAGGHGQQVLQISEDDATFLPF